MILWISNLRSFAILAVVTIHVAAIFMEQNYPNSLEWNFANLLNSLARWCVPILVAITGFLLLNQAHNFSPFHFYKKRLSKILIPTFFWLVFYTVWNVIKGFFGTDHSYDVLFGNLISGHPYYHLWYLYMLIPLYLLFPFINLFVCRLNVVFFTILVVSLFCLSIFMQISTTEFHQYKHWSLWFVAYLNYFLLGGLLHKMQVGFGSKISLSIYFVSVAITFFGYSMFAETGVFYYMDGDYFYTYSSFNVVLMSVTVLFFFKTEKFFSEKNLLPYLSDKTFGIYLVHPFIIDFLFFCIAKAGVIFSPLLIPFFVLSIVYFSAFLVNFISHIPYVRKII